MPRNKHGCHRGLLGIVKPTEPVLFSFVPNGGMQEWPSDDDDDDDYDPDKIDYSDDDDDRRLTVNYKMPIIKKGKRLSSRKRKASVTSLPPLNQDNAKKQQKKIKEKKLSHNKSHTDTNSDLVSTEKDTDDTSRRADDSKGQLSDQVHQLWGQGLPMIALLKILQHAVDSDGAVPLLCRASRVCKLWREAASHSSLWQHVDLANCRIKCTDSTLDWLAQNRLAQLRSINLAGWKKLSDAGIQAVVNHCSNQLSSIRLSGCIHLTSVAVYALADNCSQLHTLDLSNAPGDLISTSTMAHIQQALGCRLRVLNLAGNMLKGTSTILKTLMTYCPNLTMLDISNCKFSAHYLMLPIEELQQSLPELEVLRLAGCMVRASTATSKQQAMSTGFPNLQELSLAVNLGITNAAIDDNMLLRLLIKSHQLRLLDLRCCTHITAAGIQRLPVKDLQHLFIAQCSVHRYEGIEEIIAKWRHSLVQLDLSWNVFPAMSLDLAMKQLSSVPMNQSVLRILNLAGTSITADGVRSILEGCPNLESLSLASCRGLPRDSLLLVRNIVTFGADLNMS